MEMDDAMMTPFYSRVRVEVVDMLGFGLGWALHGDGCLVRWCRFKPTSVVELVGALQRLVAGVSRREELGLGGLTLSSRLMGDGSMLLVEPASDKGAEPAWCCRVPAADFLRGFVDALAQAKRVLWANRRYRPDWCPLRDESIMRVSIGGLRRHVADGDVRHADGDVDAGRLEAAFRVPGRARQTLRLRGGDAEVFIRCCDAGALDLLCPWLLDCLVGALPSAWCVDQESPIAMLNASPGSKPGLLHLWFVEVPDMRFPWPRLDVDFGEVDCLEWAAHMAMVMRDELMTCDLAEDWPWFEGDRDATLDTMLEAFHFPELVAALEARGVVLPPPPAEPRAVEPSIDPAQVGGPGSDARVRATAEAEWHRLAELDERVADRDHGNVEASWRFREVTSRQRLFTRFCGMEVPAGWMRGDASDWIGEVKERFPECDDAWEHYKMVHPGLECRPPRGDVPLGAGWDALRGRLPVDVADAYIVRMRNFAEATLTGECPDGHIPTPAEVSAGTSVRLRFPRVDARLRERLRGWVVAHAADLGRHLARFTVDELVERLVGRERFLHVGGCVQLLRGHPAWMRTRAESSDLLPLAALSGSGRNLVFPAWGGERLILRFEGGGYPVALRVCADGACVRDGSECPVGGPPVWSEVVRLGPMRIRGGFMRHSGQARGFMVLAPDAAAGGSVVPGAGGLRIEAWPMDFERWWTQVEPLLEALKHGASIRDPELPLVSGLDEAGGGDGDRDGDADVDADGDDEDGCGDLDWDPDWYPWRKPGARFIDIDAAAGSDLEIHELGASEGGWRIAPAERPTLDACQSKEGSLLEAYPDWEPDPAESWACVLQPVPAATWAGIAGRPCPLRSLPFRPIAPLAHLPWNAFRDDAGDLPPGGFWACSQPGMTDSAQAWALVCDAEGHARLEYFAFDQLGAWIGGGPISIRLDLSTIRACQGLIETIPDDHSFDCILDAGSGELTLAPGKASLRWSGDLPRSSPDPAIQALCRAWDSISAQVAEVLG